MSARPSLKTAFSTQSSPRSVWGRRTHRDQACVVPGAGPKNAILAERNTPFYASEISVLQRGRVRGAKVVARAYRAPLLLPPPLWGRVGVGGGEVWHIGCPTRRPPPPTPPHKGEGRHHFRICAGVGRWR